ncbi:MAG: GNAT family N-acetyltransferase [Candidatus Micrarchaeota archaeon]
MQKNPIPRDDAITPAKRAVFPTMGTVGESIMGRRNGKQMLVLFRQFRQRDGQACSRILMENFVDSVFWGNGIPTREDMLKARMTYSTLFIAHTARTHNYRVVLLDGEVAGMCGFLREGDRAKIVDVSVAMPLQGNGIGDFMVRTLIEEISAIEGIRTMCLFSSPIAFGIYRRHGFAAPDYPESALLDSFGNIYMERPAQSGQRRMPGM